MVFKKQKRTKYDAPAPIVGKCDVDKFAIWNKRDTVSVSKELESIVFNAFRKEKSKRA